MRGRDEIRALLVDERELFRRGLRALLEEHRVRVVGEAADGRDAARLAARARPDVVVIDPHGRRAGGAEAVRRVASAAAPPPRVLVLTASADARHAVDAILAGAGGYLLEDAPPGDIVAGVRDAAAGEAPISPRVAAGLIDRLRPSRVTPPADGAALSRRELEVLRLLADGRGNEDIADALVISPRTVKNHVSSILGKVHARNRIQAAVYAVRHGIA